MISLASAKRVGEVQAFLKQVVFRGRNAILSFLSSLVTKTESTRFRLLRSGEVPSLADLTGLEQERLNCPVRAIYSYLGCLRCSFAS